MSNTQNIGTSGARLLMHDGTRQLGGTSCCCTHVEVVSPCTICDGCCEALLVTFSWDTTAGGGTTGTKTGVMIRDTDVGFGNCGWSVDTDDIQATIQCNGGGCTDGTADIPSPNWTMNIIETSLGTGGRGCTAFFYQFPIGGCPGDVWTVSTYQTGFHAGDPCGCSCCGFADGHTTGTLTCSTSCEDAP